MNPQTSISAKGQIVIPEDIRVRLRIAAGDRLDVIEQPNGVFLRKRPKESVETADEITKRIRARVSYSGPALSIEDMDKAIDEMWASADASRSYRSKSRNLSGGD